MFFASFLILSSRFLRGLVGRGFSFLPPVQDAGGFFARAREAVVLALILSLVIPLPLAGGGALADSGAAPVHARQGGGSSYVLPSSSDPSYLAQRGLNYGMGMVNGAAEGLFLGVMDSPYGGAKARFNFMVDLDGKVNGEGDLLLPWWDSKYTTIYSQFGARTMNAEESRDRWIGNVGLGQRWYPLAVNNGVGDDAGNLMIGYNAFFDNDFTRSHQRGGVGIEGQYDWLHLAFNSYFPLSSWKNSKDFDGDFVKERPAEGWDIRAKGYLPFYRNVAITGAYTQWFGDHVGMFGASRLEKDPKIWSYGLEYTPIPLVSGFVNQRTTERGRSDTEVGLRMTYAFNMPWDEQTSHSKVAQLRTVGASRHEFVDRENRIILEYKAADTYQIEYLGLDGGRGFLFRIKHPLNGYIAGQTVRVTAGGNYLAKLAPVAPTAFFAQAVNFLDDLISVKAAYAADLSKTYTTDSQGRFWVQLDASAPATVPVTVQVGNTSQNFILQGSGAYSLVAAPSTVTNGGPAQLTFSGPASTAVAWTLVSGPGTLSLQQTTTNTSGVATATLTGDATGSGPIVVKATVNSVDYTVTVTIGTSYSLSFGTVTGPGGGFTATQTATIPVTLLQNGVAYTTPTPVTWSIVSADNTTNQAVVASYASKATGLAWGSSATGSPGTELTATTTSPTNGSGVATMGLTDVMGERTIRVKAEATAGSQTVNVEQDITFGAGPLARFKAPLSGTYKWSTVYPVTGTATNFPAAQACGGSVSYSGDGYYASSNLPSRADLKTVATVTGNGAYAAAGWGYYYWTGEVTGSGSQAFIVYGYGGSDPGSPVQYNTSVVCLR